MAYTGYDACPSHHRFPQADLYTRSLQKTSTPFLFTISLKFSQSSLTPFRLFFQMFLLPHFLLAQKLLEGLCRDSSDSSIRALPMSWPLNKSLLSFVEEMSLFSAHNWGWSMQRHLETCQTRFTFSPLASSIIIIIMTFVHIHTLNFLLPKNCSRKKLSYKFKKW